MRVGKNAELYAIYKLRTMVKDAEKKGAQWATKSDVRVTKFGAILRKTRLDEVPQFINVFKGDMSFIGPRPERPEFVDELEKQIPFYEIRHVIKPGVTGWAQVNAKYASSAEDTLEKLQYDLYYIKNRNIFLDLRVILKTFTTVIFSRGQ
jgi:lipopolysaccharide/colanic/teichoic acid biosynthesis glycosyltransferase